MPGYLMPVVSPIATPAAIAAPRPGRSRQRATSQTEMRRPSASSVSGLSVWLSRTWRKSVARRAAAARPSPSPPSRRPIAHTAGTVRVPASAESQRP